VFRGSLLSDPDYSNNVRQTLMEMFLKDPQPDIVYGNHNSSYAEEMRQSKFCIFIKGWTVWSERLGTLINAGCIPVIISDHYSLPFSKNLDWTTISLRLSMKDAVVPGKLKKFLSAVTDERGMELEANLARVQNSLQYNIPLSHGDVFDRILLELTQQKPRIKPKNGVHQWSR
jgi:xylogalacturonan beta-1,3-xylosyltransferase